ncbi:hypothetical protein ACFYNO_15480 [Kitasatospora sp. NPDC006697]|uniref:hypothetical protein n=1 Tax=unclassified Kitasatospora TaxID=2633591 RepID=UPI0036B4ABE3
MSPEPFIGPAATTRAIIWDDYPLLDSGDPAKRDLELVHTGCGQHLCDAEPGDVVPTLIGMVTDHHTVCAGQRAQR